MEGDQKVTFFGEVNFRNKNQRFGIKTTDRRKHFYIVGKTGMGKTTLLENMAMQDIQSGEGIAFIDPHGETASKLLDFVPQSRIKDVIYFDPADRDFPIGFNIMEDVGPERRHFVASGLMGVFKKIFGPDVWSARMEYIRKHRACFA
jgi:DNA helicase HerA-like ATPase